MPHTCLLQVARWAYDTQTLVPRPISHGHQQKHPPQRMHPCLWPVAHETHQWETLMLQAVGKCCPCGPQLSELPFQHGQGTQPLMAAHHVCFGLLSSPIGGNKAAQEHARRERQVSTQYWPGTPAGPSGPWVSVPKELAQNVFCSP